ncbi:MAG: ATP-binding protein [Clostridia bacterium]|nr:ATP-binding protein [Clostridia bacterium]
MENSDINSLIILRNVLTDNVFSQFVKYKNSGKKEDFACFAGSLIAAGSENNFMQYVADKILCDENAVSVTLACGKEPSSYAKKAYLRDVKLILDYAADTETHGYFNIGCPPYPLNETTPDDVLYAKIKRFYKKNGYGKFIKYRAFTYSCGDLLPIENPSAITLGELKDYCYEKAIIEDNIFNFVGGLPFSNMLLYGDRGTGKSSTIHAMLNKYSKKGLRIIEINKENMLYLPDIRQKLINNPLKFIIFVDDLSLNENDDKISGLKAALEGSVSGNTANTMIVATSNRGHIIKENFSDRDDSVHRNDSMQEQLSLSDRFGITVLFSSTGKEQYLSIIKQLAEDCGITMDSNELCSLAEKWAISKGGRSPRRAKQFVDLALSCQKKNTKIEF